MAHVPRPSLKDRLRQRYAIPREPVPFDLPPVSRIPAAKLADIELLAHRARAGDHISRDLLYLSLQPRLVRIGHVLRPWPNTPAIIGIWDDDDVAQETYLIFVELLDTWDDELPFIPYLLGRFIWRLRDRILRGIGKPNVPRGMTSVYERDELALLLGDEQPESAAIARETLERLITRLAQTLELQGEHHGHLSIIGDHRRPLRGRAA